MFLSSFLIGLELVLSVLLSVLILLQHRASGLSSTFGGSGSIVVQRRGAERALYQLTIYVSIAFFALPVALWFVAA